MKAGEDFITTSFIENKDGTIDIFNFSGIDPNEITHISIDQTYQPNVFGRYNNSDIIEYYSIKIIDVDLDRNIVKISKCKKYNHFDLKQYKREKIIDKIIH